MAVPEAAQVTLEDLVSINQVNLLLRRLTGRICLMQLCFGGASVFIRLIKEINGEIACLHRG